ncbi:hypothetical protein QUF64_06440 [Anaerolineales bacterium HSG6]|nr:hypothetical protein [Anaerolineales bacterium HSG6]
MNIVQIQINHKENITIKELAIAFYNEIGEEYDLSEEDVAEFFHIENRFLIPNGTFITVFTLDFPELELRDQTPQKILISYLNSLNEDDNILAIIKTSDFVLYNRAFQYYQEIIELEMELRNILTYIMAFDQRTIDESLFKDFGVGLAPSHNPNNISNHYENGFFYILFNQYAEFLEPKQLTDKQMSELLRDPSIQTFEMFRERLLQKGISEERHINFLSSILTKMKPLEDMRNAIMHIRNLSNKVVQNYKKATDIEDSTTIKRLIQQFWEQENESLKKQTWLALAQSQIKKTVSLVSEQDGYPLFRTDSDQYLYELDEEYIGIDTLKLDLLPYLFDTIELENFDPSAPYFEVEVNEMVDAVLAELTH